MVMSGCKIGLELDRAAEKFDGQCRSVRLSGQHTEHVRGIDIVRLVLENLLIHSLRFYQPTPAMEIAGQAHVVLVGSLGHLGLL
jgi:hypothetical protein